MFVDMHCDTMLKIKNKFEDFDFSISQAYEMGGGVQIFACYIDVKSCDKPFEIAIEYINHFKSVVELDNRIEIACNYNDILRICQSGRVAALLSIEDCAILEANLDNLHILYNMGVRVATLTWNFENEVASGSKARGGLKPFGRELIKEMGKLNMVIDVSHINKQGFYDVLQASESVVIASHSCSYDVFAHKRNITSDQFRDLIKNGGAIGVSFYPFFLNGTRHANISDVLNHIEHFLEISSDSVGFGSDFDGIKYKSVGLSNTGDIKKICDKIKDRHGIEIMQKVSYKNMMNLFEKYL